MRKPAFAYFYGLCILMSFSLLNITVRRVSNKHCLLPFFIGTKSQFISSPEPKAHCELIVYQSIRRLCVHIVKHEYLRNQWADCNQFLSEASLGRGKGCNIFLARSDWNSSFHGNG